jgi:hypothetical protein
MWKVVVMVLFEVACQTFLVVTEEIHVKLKSGSRAGSLNRYLVSTKRDYC